jgi:alkylated DNA repair dioxygenase AlkB
MMDLFDNRHSLPFSVPIQEGYATEYIENIDGFRIIIPNGELLYVENFFEKKISDRTVEYFQENDKFEPRNTKWADIDPDDFARIQFTNLKWKQDYIKLYGKTIPLPRLTSWYGNSESSYTYSGITSTPNEWNKGLLYLKKKIEEFSGDSFNSVLLNWYRNGDDYLNWHADDEKELGKNPTIASANFGETRDFILRKNTDNTEKLVLPLKHGTLLVMKGEIQHYWQHSVPKRKKVLDSRFNLTFREIHAT